MSSNTQPEALLGVGQPNPVDLQNGHAPQEERKRECPAVDLVREHLRRQVQALKQQRTSLPVASLPVVDGLNLGWVQPVIELLDERVARLEFGLGFSQADHDFVDDLFVSEDVGCGAGAGFGEAFEV